MVLMDIKKVAAIYCVIIGVSMIGMWSAFLVADSVPEIDTKPAEIGLHILAEFLTAASLIIAGFGLLSRRNWGSSAYLVASGLLTYTLIVSPGYYVTRGEAVFVAMFALFLVIDLVLLVIMLRKGPEGLDNSKRN
jgi:peptidoglycan/LPS O-acetylase OafA/YrhL